MKPDMSLFPVLQDESQFHAWWTKFKATAAGTQLGEVCDFNYVPTNSMEFQSFHNKCAWMYTILSYHNIKTTCGRDILDVHMDTYCWS